MSYEQAKIPWDKKSSNDTRSINDKLHYIKIKNYLLLFSVKNCLSIITKEG